MTIQFSKSTGYALHALIRLAYTERGQYVGIRELSTFLGVSESYLSKIMSKLRQDGIVRAITGANGGYELARAADQITFLEVIQVVEGRQSLYECFSMNEQRHQLFFGVEALESPASVPSGKECLVEKVMNGAELHMQQYLQQHTIQWVLDYTSFAKNDETGKKS